VFLLLDNFKIVKDEKIRVIYVAITRAKENLDIYTNIDIFDSIWVQHQNSFIDNNPYAPPARLSLQLTYRDVYLDYFTNDSVMETIKTLQAGDKLTISQRDPRIVYTDDKEVLMFSIGASENLKKFSDKGYGIKSIHAEYIVIWKKKEENIQYRVVLPRVELLKK
jgi:ATP-dependent DNA helicase RecQ